MSLNRLAENIDDTFFDAPFHDNETEPTIDKTLDYIEWLMIWYCRKPSVLLANIIVVRLQSLRIKVSQGENIDPDWTCQRLLQNWEYIAQRIRCQTQS